MPVTFLLDSINDSNISLAIKNHVCTNNLFSSSFLSINNCIIFNGEEKIVNEGEIRESDLLLVSVNDTPIPLSVYRDIKYSLIHIKQKL